MRPTFHCAAMWPCSAAYSSEVSAFAFSPPSGPCAGLCRLSGASKAVFGAVVPSKASAGRGAMPDPGPNAKPNPTAPRSAISTPLAATRPTLLDVRIARLLDRSAGVGDGAFAGRPDLLGILPQIAGGVLGL